MICCPKCGFDIAAHAAAGLTAKQAELLTFIVTFIAERGFSPSVKEMKEGISLRAGSGVHRLLLELRDRKRIDWEPFKARSWTVLPLTQEAS